VILVAGLIVGRSPIGPAEARAQVNGTTPTTLTTFAPRLLSGNRLEVTCRLTTLSGKGLAGMYPVRLFQIFPTYSVAAGAANTDNGGYATLVIPKPPAGTMLAWDYAGNGTYSRPLHQVRAP
jgi:hypothetical protein